MATSQSKKRTKKRGSKQPVQLRRTLEYPLLAQTRKEISNQDVGFDNLTAILEVEGRQIPSPVFPRARYNLRWEDLEKLTIPLTKIFEHYAIDLRSQNKSDRTVEWYTANLRAFETWLKKHRRPALLSDINIDTVPLYVLYLQDERPKY